MGLIRLPPLVLLWGLLAACAPSDQARESIRVGLLPDESRQAQEERFMGLFEHLSVTTGLTFYPVRVDNYADLLTRFGRREVDLAYFGAYTFVRAHLEHGALPIAMRDTDLQFRSSFIAHADDPRNTLAGFAGERFSFGSDLSTSGHLMPRHFMADWDIEPESFFSEVVYSGSHTNTIEYVVNGRATIGVANSEIVDNYLADHETVKVVRVTPPYADYVWAGQPDLTPGDVERILDGFLSLSAANASDKKILDAVGAGGFMPASMSDFTSILALVRNIDGHP